MASVHRSLLMRANRLLGANLVEANLVKLEDLEPANERLLGLADTELPRQCTVLGVLAYEMKDTLDDIKKTLDIDACWATWSVPFDREEDFTFIATAYYLSPAVRTFWEKQCNGPILWFGTTLEGIADHLEKLTADRAAMPAAVVPTPV